LLIKHTERITVYKELFKINHYHALMIHYEKQNKVMHVSLLQYNQRSLLHVSATYCGQLQGGVLSRIYYTQRNTNLIYKYEMLGLK